MEQVGLIPSLVRRSVSALGRLSLALAEESSLASEFATSRSHLSKLKLWSGCLGAHRIAGTRSLSYRLRDASSIRETVLFLLENLERHVKEARAIAQQESIEHEDEDAQASTDEELAEYFCSKSSDESHDNADLKRTLLQIEEILDCLMRLAITIRNPAPYDQFKSRTGLISLPYQWDTEHVQHKFPNIHPIISDRLGKALTQRRQYLRYREEHHLLLQEGLDKNDHDDDDGSRGKGTTIASYLPHDTMCGIPTPLEDIGDTHSEISTTSYATTSADQGAHRIPPIPLEYESGPFLCPFCRMIISIDAENEWKAKLEWKKHVYRDLRPYVCLEIHCTVASQDFQRRKDWTRHMIQEHWRIWTCPFDCVLGFRNFKDSRNHTLENHEAQVTTERVNNLVSLSSNADPMRAAGKCPLCLTFDIKNNRAYESHVGKHLEQLSLFVLPHISDDEIEKEDGIEDDQHGDPENNPERGFRDVGGESGSDEPSESSPVTEDGSQDGVPDDRAQPGEHQDGTLRATVQRCFWYCLPLITYDMPFHETASRPGEADTCGYCGKEFARSGLSLAYGRYVTNQEREERVRHLEDVHKFRKCNAYEKFHRVEHFRQHLKHSHGGRYGEWTKMLEKACMTQDEIG